VLRDHKKTAEGIKNDTATDTDSVAVVSDMTSDFAGNAEHGETVRQDQKDEMSENMPVENTMAMASSQTPMFEIHRAEPEEFYQEPSDSYVQPTAEQDVPELSECYSEPEPVETYAEVQQVQEPVSENVPESVPQPETRPASQSVKNPKSSKQEIESGIQNIQKEITQQNEVVKREYHYPPLKLLKRGDGKSQGDSDEHLRKTAKKLQDTLHNFGVNVTVTNVSCGPTVTRYELQPEMGVKVSKIVNLADDIKLNLATPDIRIEAPIPGKAAVGIEVPNKENHAVMLREILQSQEFQSAKSRLSFAVGKDIAGKPVVTDIAKMPHLLIAGATGSGKSVCINTLIVSILYKASPEDVKLIMIDPKVVELSVYNGIPHLFIPVVTDPKKAAGALNWAVTEMMNRYNTFAEYSVRNLQEYNRKVEGMRIPEGEERPEKMPQIVIIVDELADLMMVAPGEVEDAICRLAQLARAAGIHLIIATQRPSVNVITGLIKANMPSRIAFSVSSGVDSRTILDMNGAEKLLGKGDMLFYPQGYQKPARLQGAFVSDEEVSSIVDFLAEKNPGMQYNSQIEQQVNTAGMSGGTGGSSADDRDAYFVEAGKFIIEKEKASIGMLQRMFKIGFNRAARIMDQLCDAGVVGPEEGTKPRKVLMSAEEFENYIEEYL
jgi:Ftsk gamma domain